MYKKIRIHRVLSGMNSILQIKSMTNNSFESTNNIFDEFRLFTLNCFHKPWIRLR